MNEILGYFTYKNTKISQHSSIDVPIKKLLNNLKPSQIVEIGTAQGGFTLLVRDLLNDSGLKGTPIKTYDIHTENNIKLYYNDPSQIDVVTKNIFNDNYSGLKAGEEEIINFIQQQGVTIVFCDGALKKKEFNILSKYIKPGDIIMAHDYAPNQEYFNENVYGKIWNWFEIQDADIEEACISNKLLPYMQQEFRDVVWVCKIKS
jgi:hypothetical protein